MSGSISIGSKPRTEGRFLAVKSRQRGETLVEFSLVFVVYLLLVLGLMEFGRLLWTQHTLAHATRQAARYAIVRGSMHKTPATAAQIKQVLAKHALGLEVEENAQVTWTPDNNPGDVIEIQGHYNFQPVTGGFLIPGGAIPLRTTTTMVIVN